MFQATLRFKRSPGSSVPRTTDNGASCQLLPPLCNGIIVASLFPLIDSSENGKHDPGLTVEPKRAVMKRILAEVEFSSQSKVSILTHVLQRPISLVEISPISYLLFVSHKDCFNLFGVMALDAATILRTADQFPREIVV